MELLAQVVHEDAGRCGIGIGRRRFAGGQLRNFGGWMMALIVMGVAVAEHMNAGQAVLGADLLDAMALGTDVGVLEVGGAGSVGGAWNGVVLN